eukprot:TRINITY_DN2038_c2_g2_i1.p1 TRINITY_DN2038_c2_g2~~TRINITY_DN2038_c2_g2_i1.p1  ORF type:complete len:767 (-),score=360.06 TRINITY_DN2038_c2_g2_i1:48-2306(-)
MSADNNVQLFISIGLAENKAKETAKNPKLTKNLLEILKIAGINEGCDKSVGILLYNLAAKPLSITASKHLPLLVNYICEKKIKALNLPFAITYLENLDNKELNVSEFESETGVGIEITEAQILHTINQIIENSKVEINEKRIGYKATILAKARQQLKFVDGKVLNDISTAQFNQYLQTLPAAEAVPVQKKVEEVKRLGETLPESIHFPPPTANKQIRPEILAAHLAATSGKVMTRFPPEPNGFLHIGHAKSMFLNFKYAEKYGGHCYLRYDDTNPAAEKIEYIQSIEEVVRWIGYTPYKITHAADYFDQLYDFAIELIKRGKGYVCHETAEQMNEGRENCRESPYRNRPIEESLKLFQDMRDGKFKEGEAVLRMKGNMSSPNPCMRDLVAYRIKYVPHPHVGDKWCIYPSYDFTHCLCDSIENITHSLCTLEFEPRREPYNWLCDSLEIYRPPQIEFSRLNLTYTIVSKRRLVKLVEGKFVNGWSDPRLSTLIAFRRKGYRPQAINDFCERVGVTRNKNLIDYGLLETCCRQDLENFANRAFAITKPLKIIITNYEGLEHFVVANHPSDTSRGTRQMPFSNVIYIEQSDFRLVDAPDYFGLAPGKEVGLRYAYNITCTEAIQNEKGEVLELRATIDKQKQRKPKGHIHWVANPEPGKTPLEIEIRFYKNLFKSPNVAEMENWLEDINPDSLEILKGYGEPILSNLNVGDKIQFERIGFFCLDQDSTPALPVYNRTVSLRDTYAKIQAKNSKK